MKAIAALYLFFLIPHLVLAQEGTAALLSNKDCVTPSQIPHRKTRAVSLPFIDDFSYKQNFASPVLWRMSKNVYINNTFCVDPITYGVATFDALNGNGEMYVPNNINAKFYADSLMSEDIDLSPYTAADSLYLSFYIQAQGNGFRPEPSDSMLLFFKDVNNAWVRVWYREGSALTPFIHVMVPVKATAFFHNKFQMLFCNRASPNANDDIWNLDYVRLAAGRTIADSIINDVAFVKADPSILKNYTSMPYWHFYDYRATEQDTQYQVYVRNNFTSAQVAGVNNKITETLTSVTVNAANASVAPAAGDIDSAVYSAYGITFQPSNSFGSVYFRHQYYYGQVPGDVRVQNDTLNKIYSFENYFAYDDGSAEKAYFLYGLINYPVSTALAFHVNRQDTLRGLGVKFAPQIPPALGKKFSIVLYKDLGSNTQPQQILHQEDNFEVRYTNDREAVTTYGLAQPVALDSGLYYIGTTQLPNTNSDTIYFGLDMNTNANTQHLYYNVNGQWAKSNTEGSVMIRPIVGPKFSPTNIGTEQGGNLPQLIAYPNPVHSVFQVSGVPKDSRYQIIDINGNVVASGYYNGSISLMQFASGAYMLYLPQYEKSIKIVKQ